MDDNKLTLDDVADFTWDFGTRFLLETSKGNFVWYSPDYEGCHGIFPYDYEGCNGIYPYDGDPKNFVEDGFAGRSKGRHVIRDYCGPDAQIRDRREWENS